MLKRKTIKKMFYFIVALMIAIPLFAWAYVNFFLEIDTAEVDRYYDLLSKHAGSAGKPVLDLGVKEDEDLKRVVKKIKDAMGLKYSEIKLSYNDLPKPPAYIIDAGDNDIEISLSRTVRTRREQINVLVHEMCHIYVRNLNKSVFGQCDQERLVDCAGVFLGLGALILNGLTDDIFVLPGEGYETQRKFFGYLKPEQFGYLFARYCVEQNIAPRDMIPSLNGAGRKYFKIGLSYLKRKNGAG